MTGSRPLDKEEMSQEQVKNRSEGGQTGGVHLADSPSLICGFAQLLQRIVDAQCDPDWA